MSTTNRTMNITYQPVKVRIIQPQAGSEFMSVELRKAGLSPGDEWTGRREFYRGEPKLAVFLDLGDRYPAVAYVGTTCEIVEE